MKYSELKIGVGYKVRGVVSEVKFASLTRYRKQSARRWGHDYVEDPKGMYLKFERKGQGQFEQTFTDYVHIPQIMKLWSEYLEERRQEKEASERRNAEQKLRMDKRRELAELVTELTGKWANPYSPLDHNENLMFDLLTELKALRNQ